MLSLLIKYSSLREKECKWAAPREARWGNLDFYIGLIILINYLIYFSRQKLRNSLSNEIYLLGMKSHVEAGGQHTDLLLINYNMRAFVIKILSLII